MGIDDFLGIFAAKKKGQMCDMFISTESSVMTAKFSKTKLTKNGRLLVLFLSK